MKKVEFVSREERELIAKEATFIPQSKTGEIVFDEVIIDMKKAIKIMREFRRKNGLSMNVEIIKINTGNNKINELHLEIPYVRDEEFDVFYGRYNGISDAGNIKWTKTFLDQYNLLNLNNDYSAAIWIIARMSAYVRGSIYEKSSQNVKAYYYVVDAKMDLDKMEDKFKQQELALNRLKKMSAEEMVRFARLLGVSIPNYADAVDVKKELYNVINSNPFRFNESYESKSKAVEEIVKSAIELGIINSTPNGYLYRGSLLGSGYDTVVKILVENAGMLQDINLLLKESDKAVIAVNNSLEHKPVDNEY